MFEELDEIGRSLPEEVMDAGLPVHGAGGDVNKCPYYAAKTGDKGFSQGFQLLFTILTSP